MEEALLFLSQVQGWIYLLLALAFVVYLRQAWRAFLEFRRSQFTLERERSTSRLSRAGAMLALLLAGAGVTFVLTEFFSPAIPASDRPTPESTVFLLATPVTLAPSSPEAFASATALPPLAIDSSGCANPLATLTAPLPDAELRGQVEIRGTANIINFAFYRFEYINLTPGSSWRAIEAYTTPVGRTDDVLGAWDTQNVASGDYAFRLVVTDTAGNSVPPCVVRVRVLPGG